MSNRPMMTSAPHPAPAPSEPLADIEEIRLDADRRHLRLSFSGRPAAPAVLSAPVLRASLSAPALRAACRCATCVADRARGRFRADFAGVTLTHVAPFGAHGLNLSFSDGHARGVYPFAYLAALAAEPAASDLPEVNP